MRTYKNSFPIKVPVIKIEQPLGVFYVAALDASILLKVSYSTPAKAIENEDNKPSYNIFGTQREKKEKRLKEIAHYIDTVEAAFPNSIILGANYHEDGNLEESEEKRWHITKNENDSSLFLVIPTEEKLASIIDGQHRLFAFEESDRKSMQLLCAIYLDLPLPYHAYIFATINFNQKKVDKSLAYQLFGFNLEEEPAQSWSPETLAVYLTRIFDGNPDSPFCGHIMIGVQDDTGSDSTNNWLVSMATVVDGILKLITSNPKRDRDLMHKTSILDGRNRSKLVKSTNLPLRKWYIDGNDLGIYTVINNFFIAAKKVFWESVKFRSFIIKTVGIQALFDILKIMLDDVTISEMPLADLNSQFFADKLSNAQHVDFSDNFFQASGTGRGRIKNIIGISMGVIDLNALKISESDRQDYNTLLPNLRY